MFCSARCRLPLAFVEVRDSTNRIISPRTTQQHEAPAAVVSTIALSTAVAHYNLKGESTLHYPRVQPCSCTAIPDVQKHG